MRGFKEISTVIRPRPVIDQKTVTAGIVLFAVAFLIFLPAYSADRGNFIGVATFAERMWESREIIAPHFLAPLLISLFEKLLPFSSYLQATWFTTAIVQAFCSVLLFLIINPLLAVRGAKWAIGWSMAVALSLLIVGPITVFTAFQPNLYGGYFNSHTFHSTSAILVLPLAIILFLASIAAFPESDEKRPWSVIVTVMGVHILAMIAKPTFSVYFVPTVCAVSLVAWWQGRRIDLRFIVLAFLLPFLLIAVAQFVVTYTSHSIVSSQRIITIDPFRVILRTTSVWMIIPKLVLSILFPLSVATLYRQRRANRLEFMLAWTGFAIAASYAYLLIETDAFGNQWYAGNFWWCVQLATFMLFLVYTRVIVREYVERSGAVGGRFWVCVTIFCVHFVCGLAWYVVSVMGVHNAFR